MKTNNTNWKKEMKKIYVIKELKLSYYQFFRVNNIKHEIMIYCFVYM